MKHNDSEITDYTYGSVTCYNTVNQFGIHMIIVRLIKVYLNETHCRYRLGKCCVTCFLLRIFEQRKFFFAIAFQVCFTVCL